MGGNGSDGRFKSAMDKLLQLEALTSRAASSAIAPRRTPAKPGAGRDFHSEQSLSAGTPTSFVPVCRPWERADLLRRLATFKSSTWFGKPPAAGPVACARRGWVNIESDLLACEGCGAQLSFVVPPTWSRQQANKAAEDFAKKLEAAHRELCAWQGNTCPEALVQFPPTTSSTLQAAFSERCERLMELPGLPVVAKEALETMRASRGPQVTKLLEQGPSSPLKDLETSPGPGAGSALQSQYLESLRLIAICGWEPRLLPASILPPFSHPTTPPLGLLPATPQSQTPSLTSVVLDCGLCGASVGLWSFSSVERPQTGPVFSPGPAVAEIDEEGLALQIEEQPTRSTAHRPSKEEKEQPTQSTGHNGADRPEPARAENPGRPVRSLWGPEKRTQDEADSKQAGSMLAPSGRKGKGLPPARQQPKREGGAGKGEKNKSRKGKEKELAVDEKGPATGGASKVERKGADGMDAKRAQQVGANTDEIPGKGATDVKKPRSGLVKAPVPSPGPIDIVDLSPTRLLPLGAPTLADMAWSTIAGGTTAAALGEQVPEESGPFGRTPPNPKPDSSSKPEQIPSDGAMGGDSKSDGNDNHGQGGGRTVVASSARPPRSPIVDLNLTIAGGPPPTAVGELAIPVFGPGAILQAPIFGLAKDPPVQAASFESRGAPAPPPAAITPDSRQNTAQGFSQGISHDGKLSHFSPQIAGGSTVTTPHNRTLKRKPADSAEGMVLENDGGDDEMEVEGGGRPAIPAHLMVRGSSRFSRPADREARPQETAGVESVNVDAGGSVEARGAPDDRAAREASVSGMAGDRAGSVDTRYRRPASREVEGEPSVDVMDSAGGTSAAVVEEVEEVMGAPRAAKRRRIADGPWRGGQVGRLAAEGSPGEGDFPRTSSVNATATNHDEQPETSTESVRNMPRADSQEAVREEDERAPNDDEATTQPPPILNLDVSPGGGQEMQQIAAPQPARSASDQVGRFGFGNGFLNADPGFGFQGFGALPEEGVVSTGPGVAISAGMGEGESEERGAMGSEGLGAGGSTGKDAPPSLEPSLGGSTRAGYGRLGSIGPGVAHSFAGEAGYDTEEATAVGVARPWSGVNTPRGRGPQEPQLEQSIIHTPVRGLIVGGNMSSGSEGSKKESRGFALDNDTPRTAGGGGRTFTNGTAEAEVRGGDEEELADAEGGMAPQDIAPPVFVEPHVPTPPGPSLRLPSLVASPGGLTHPAEFDPLRQHRHFCPWVNAHPGGRTTDAVPTGWQRCLEAVTADRAEARPAISSRQDNESSGSFARVDYGTSAASLLRAALTRRPSLDESRM